MEGSLKKEGFELYNGSRVFFESPNDGFSYFFGYYDKMPLDKNNSKLLSHKAAFDGRDVTKHDNCAVGYFDLTTNQYITLGFTSAWNWQQGASLQWLPNSDYKKIIFNDYDPVQGYISKVVCVESAKVDKIIPFPIYSLHPSGSFALSVNYKRLYWCRPGYNYQQIADKKWDRTINKNDGIYRLDLISGEVELIISILDIINHNYLDDFRVCNSWVEHISINPSGNRFIFFHRWNKNGLDYTRCFSANLDGSDIYMFPDVKFYSHATWKSDNEITIWAVRSDDKKKGIQNFARTLKNNPLTSYLTRTGIKVLKKIIGKDPVAKILPISALLNFNDKSDAYIVIGKDILFGNGHSTWNKDRSVLLNDTYEDSDGCRNLMLFHIDSGEKIKVGRFYSMYNGSTFRADLHPRFSLDDRYICIDSAHKRMRKIILIELGNEISS